MLDRTLYAIQPYRVGCKDKNKKSLAIIIPAKVARECNVDPSTIFALRVDRQKKIFTLHMVVDAQFQKYVTSADGVFQASNQQMSFDVR